MVIGGLEASLRRFAHYDYWKDAVMPSVLESSGADFLMFGMGENCVRELAAQLVINPNTIQRAYRELEHEGYIVSVPSKGSFATPHFGADSRRVSELLAAFDDAVAELRYLGVDGAELKKRIDEQEAKKDEA